MTKLVKMVALHRKRIDSLESRIIQKVIDGKGFLAVNLVVDNLPEEEAKDA